MFIQLKNHKVHIYCKKDIDKSKYLEIGESDRMTLLFMKPENS